MDPDNRRPVDFKKLASLLDEVEEGREETVSSLWEGRFDGRIKLWLTNLLSRERVTRKDYFARADYIPLEVSGRYERHVLSFARRFGETWYVIALPLHLASLCALQQKNITDLDWQGTRVHLPEGVPGQYKDLLLKKEVRPARELPVSLLFKTVPLALLKLE